MKTTNTVPYTNARRAGRTKPGLIEFRDHDPRLFMPAFVENRADRRRRGIRGYHLGLFAAGTRRNPVSRYQRRRGASA